MNAVVLSTTTLPVIPELRWIKDIINTMTDRFSKADRSRIMAAIGGKNTKPELKVRSALHAAGFRFRLHGKHLPGKPDIYLTRYRTAVFVHGCFWHGHNCRRGRMPASNVEFWEAKIGRNRERDAAAQKALKKQGWRIHVVWECTLEKGLNGLLVALNRLKV